MVIEEECSMLYISSPLIKAYIICIFIMMLWQCLIRKIWLIKPVLFVVCFSLHFQYLVFLLYISP